MKKFTFSKSHFSQIHKIIYLGKLHSEFIKDQKKDGKGGPLGGGLRFTMDQLAIFWVQCEQKVLEDRCDKRVDKMISAGLVPEMQDFHQNVNEQRGGNDDYTVGIFQSIGNVQLFLKLIFILDTRWRFQKFICQLFLMHKKI